ncbi:beta strand repeat-containing protein, partial [Flavobacterium sp. RHBU_3]|uniref:beta strand repeat-containing protein n=1 Tax=Flavobacterium sp. RHBU_3 TaxID=3391184 RepID=UPI00398477AC
MEKNYANVPRATILARLRGNSGSSSPGSGTLFERAHYWVVLLLVTLCSLPAIAQTGTIQIGSGTTTTSTLPIYSCYGYTYSQQIVTKAQFASGGGAAGQISKIRFYYSSSGTTTANWNNWTIYLGNTTKTSFASTTDWVAASAMTQVYSGTFTATAGTWIEFTLSTPFTWDGTSNIVVGVDENASGYSCTAAWRSYTSTSNTGMYYYSDSTNPNPASPPTASTRTATLSQIQFVGQLLPSCATPTAPSSVDLGSIASSSMTGTITPDAAAPTGYLVVASTSSTLSAAPVNNTVYTTGATLGGGNVVYYGTSTTFNATSLNPNTNYYYFVYSYNYDSSFTCLGPTYSTSYAVGNKATCVADPIAIGASNVKNDQANLNWTSSIGGGSAAVTYDAELYSDSAYTTLVSSSTGITGLQFPVTGLTANATYYWRVKVNSENCTTGTWVTGSFVAQNSYTPIDISGFNADVIANGTGMPSTTTNSDVDGVNYVYISLDYKATLSSSAATYGLPVNRLLTSSTVSGLKFIIPDYNGNNSLRLDGTTPTGTVTLTTPMKFTDIYLAVTSGSGASTVNAVINFQDGTSQTISGISLLNWYATATTAQPALISNIGRVLKTSSTGAQESGASKIFMITLSLDSANVGKTVTGFTITTTATGTTPVANIFAVSGKVIGDCPTMGSATAHGNPGFTTGTAEWVLGSPGGTDASAVTYTVEVYTDAAFTTPISGSPFTNLTGSSYTFSGLTANTTYYYKIKAANGICDSAYVTGSFYNGYCLPTGLSTSTSYYLTNVVTTGALSNLSNATGSTAGTSTVGYANYSATQSVTTYAGGSFNLALSVSSGTNYFYTWIDLNNDLDFADSGETLVATTTYTSSYSGTITIPAGTPNGTYRMRVASSYIGAISYCGPASYGEYEDYSLVVVTQPAACTTPNAIADLSLTPGSTSIAGTITPDATTPTGYIIVRSTASALTAEPVNNTSYAAGASLGGGIVIYSGTASTFNDTGLSAGTNYYYFVYAYNNGGATCLGPVYGPAYSTNKSTCTGTPPIAGASNIKNNQAIINWASVLGTNVTYTLEVYTDSGYTSAISGSPFTTTALKYALTGLTANQTYYFRVKAAADGVCESGYGTGSFVAQNSYTPIDITGFNADVIANGTGIANLSTTNDVDAVGNAYMSLDYKNSSTASAATYGLPVNRLLTSSSISGLKFIIPDYNGNNSLRLNGTTPSGTVTLTT